uniref:Uncharacterized protein n=1 Tax=Setaria digitata TaxID=48799 RepID=A0A915PTN9_9BILA
MEIGNSPAPTRSLIVDEEMPVENVAEAAFFNQIFPTNSGMRFNFDDIREFLHDPLIALIATDLTADENLDNIEMILKRVRQEKQ